MQNLPQRTLGSRNLLLSLAGLTLAAGSAQAQTLLGYDSAGMIVDEFHGGPSSALCGYPSGPKVGGFVVLPGVCPAPVPVAPGPGAPGGIAYDSMADIAFVSDGFLIGAYTMGGLLTDSFASPMPVFGMGFDPGTGLLWCTDGGGLAYALAVPPPGTCGGPTALAVPPFPIPGPGPFSDIDWDPASGSLFACDLGGMITNFMPGGGPGPFGIYPNSGAGIPLGAPLVGLTVDDASPFGPGHLYVTDGFMTEAILPGGAPAPPTFTVPFPAFPNPGLYNGLAFAAHGVSYGTGFDPDGLAAPVSTTFGASTTPSATFGHTLTSAVGGGLAVLVLGTTPACPTIPILGTPSYLVPFGPILTVATVPVPATGTVVLPTPLPAGLVPGTTLYDQWFILKPAGPSPLQSSNGIGFRIALP